ncbi:hypothetical protein Salat_2624600 [Sesamum alatum]|uniref:Uncharacterized protein n=1 Tax=Sesamum alatum TaxID=300844 RepID=A0AAE2CAL3_9LAMI|nr:hypothetical protein Salat_2624600 [Sesamum alatum]
MNLKLKTGKLLSLLHNKAMQEKLCKQLKRLLINLQGYQHQLLLKGVNFISVSKLRAVIGNQARASTSVPQAVSVPPRPQASRPAASKPASSRPPFKPRGRTISTRSSSKSATSSKTSRRLSK